MSSLLRKVRTVATLTAVSSCVMALAGCGGNSSDAVPTPGGNIGTIIDQALPKSVLGLAFTDTTGKTVRLSDFAGRTIMLSDTMTLCQETCPLDTATLVQTARAADKAGMKNVVYLTVTIDPARDTVPQIAAYRRLYTPTPANWEVLTGSASSVNALWSFLGVWRQKTADLPGAAPKNWRTGQPLTYDISHSDEVFFIDKQGHERFLLEGPPVAAKGQIPATVYKFMSAEGHKNVLHPPTTAWTQPQATTVLRWVSSV
ncbi:MAG: SCO family protein [Actinomycetota bacterium]|nr:SCO family protein [Actinomycetota bacterium]